MYIANQGQVEEAGDDIVAGRGHTQQRLVLDDHARDAGGDYENAQEDLGVERGIGAISPGAASVEQILNAECNR